MNKQLFDAPKGSVKFALTERPGRLPTLSGYAIVWNELSSDRGGYRVRLLPGSATVAKEGCFALADHDFGKVLGSTSAGTLQLLPDAHGIRVEIDPADTGPARDLISLVRRGDVQGMSFAMIGDGAVYRDIRENGEEIREYSRFFFDEVTVTAIPAFESTSIAAEFAKGGGADGLDLAVAELALLGL